MASAGIDKLSNLQKALIAYYSDLLQFFRNDIDRKIYAKNDELTNLKFTETRIKIKVGMHFTQPATIYCVNC